MKIKWIYGLKLCLALMVVFRHFANAFFPALHTGNIVDSKIVFLGGGSYLENLINVTPLYIVINGGFAVYVFWVLSAFLITYQFYNCPTESITKVMRQKIIKKYVGILGLIAISYICAYMMMHLGCFFNSKAADITGSSWLIGFYNWVPTIKQLLYSLFIDTYFTSNVPFNPVLWTIAIEFKGSVMVILLLEFFGHMKNKWVVWGIVVVFIVFAFPQQYLCFCIGVCLGYLYSKQIKLVKEAFAIGLFFLAIISGGYPSDFQPSGKFYGWIPMQYTIGVLCRDLRTDIYIFAAGIMIFSIINSKRLQGLLEIKWMVWLGKLSTEMYISHFIVQCSLACFIFCRLYQVTGAYVGSAFFALLLGLFFMVFISKILNIINRKYNAFLNTQVEKLIA